MPVPRREKICILCDFYTPATETMQEECDMDQDPGESGYCECYEGKG